MEAKVFFDICLLFVVGYFSLSFPFSCGVNRPVTVRCLVHTTMCCLSLPVGKTAQVGIGGRVQQ